MQESSFLACNNCDPTQHFPKLSCSTRDPIPLKKPNYAGIKFSESVNYAKISALLVSEFIILDPNFAFYCFYTN